MWPKYLGITAPYRKAYKSKKAIQTGWPFFGIKKLVIRYWQ